MKVDSKYSLFYLTFNVLIGLTVWYVTIYLGWFCQSLTAIFEIPLIIICVVLVNSIFHKRDFYELLGLSITVALVVRILMPCIVE